ncbi:retrovirus-related pol polyprotein from transposon TNT 1-94 [Tanacetum coccineum]
MITPGMYKVHTEPDQTRTPQLPQDIRKTNKRVSFSTGVIPSTSVSRPQLKSNQIGDRVMSNNSQGKKQEVEYHRRNFKIRQPIAVPISTREAKQNVNQSVATSDKKTVATDSTIKKHINVIRKIYEQVRTVKFGNDQIAPILGYGDLVQGTITIKRLRSRGTNLYFITLQDSTTPNPICLIAKATSSQAWLWNRRLSHLNFDTINLLSKNNIVNGLPKLKFVKDHLCSSCELGKAKRKSVRNYCKQT